MSIKDQSYFRNKIVALRKALQSLEEELGEEQLPKRRNTMREQFDMNYMSGTWRKPEHLKKVRN